MQPFLLLFFFIEFSAWFNIVVIFYATKKYHFFLSKFYIRNKYSNGQHIKILVDMVNGTTVTVLDTMTWDGVCWKQIAGFVVLHSILCNFFHVCNL